MKEILLIGGGGHCRSVIDTINKNKDYSIIGIIDKVEHVGDIINGINIVGTDDDLQGSFEKGIRYAFITLGSIGNPGLRIKLYKTLKKIGYVIPKIIDESAIVSDNTVLEEGVFVGKRAIINTNTKIGKNSIINTGTIIEHDCIIEDFVHVAPGTVLSGGIQVGSNTHIGTHSTVIQNISIGKNVLIGAGSVVIKDIENNTKAYGNPCKEVD